MLGKGQFSLKGMRFPQSRPLLGAYLHKTKFILVAPHFQVAYVGSFGT